MTTSEHLQFLALMIPTLLVLALAAVSLADPDFEALAAPAPMVVVELYEG
jgi:hypothetical protein